MGFLGIKASDLPLREWMRGCGTDGKMRVVVILRCHVNGVLFGLRVKRGDAVGVLE